MMVERKTTIIGISVLLGTMCVFSGGCTDSIAGSDMAHGEASRSFSYTDDHGINCLLEGYNLVKQTAEFRQVREIMPWIDPDMLNFTRRQLKKMGYKSVYSYLENNYTNLPQLDTLEFFKADSSNGYYRVTFKGKGLDYGNMEQVRYTMIVFRYHENIWKLSSVHQVSKDRYDMYGYPVSLP